MLTSNQSLNKIFSNNLNLKVMSNQNKPFNPLQAKDKEEVSPKQFPLVKRAYAAYMDDVLDEKIPDVVLTPECEKGYIMGYLSGCKEGVNIAGEIQNEVYNPAPTLHRQDKNISQLGEQC